MRLKSLGIFSVLRFGHISKPPTNKDLAFVTVPFLLCYDAIYNNTSAILSHAVRSKNKIAFTQSYNIRKKRKVKKKTVEGINHMLKKKSSCWPVWFGLIGATYWEKFRDKTILSKEMRFFFGRKINMLVLYRTLFAYLSLMDALASIYCGYYSEQFIVNVTPCFL